MNIRPAQATASGRTTDSSRVRSRRFLPYVSVILLTLLGLALTLVLGVFPPLETTHSPVPGQAQAQTRQPTPQADAATQLFTLPPGEIPLLQSLQKRQARLKELEKKERQLDKREEALRILRGQIDEKLTKLEMLRQEIEELVAEKEAFEEQRFEHLVKVYEGMRPAEAASLVERLHKETAVRLLFHMKGKKVGKILEAINPEIAAQLSELLAAIQYEETPAGKGKAP